MRTLLAFVFACLFIGVSAQPKLVGEVKGKPGAVVIPFQKYVLPNGLTVILTEDHSDPIVHVDVAYHVGSAREEIGKSGFAHFFEHMMFEGSDHVKSGEHFKIVNAAGGSMNGTTDQDKTHYFETVPANELEKMLWLEADRMGFLLDAVTPEKFEIQRATVKNERGQNYDNRPYGLAQEAMSKAMYPYGHPYSWLTIGYVRDLDRVGVDDLKRFFLRWYGPNNATLTIGGDIEPKQTLAWVEKYFGSIPRGPQVKKTVLPAPTLSTTRYVSYTDNYARLPLLYIGYPGVRRYDKDAAALDALSMIIGEGKSSMLYQTFIKTREAGGEDMSSYNEELAGMISIQVLPYPGQTLAAVKLKIDSVLAAFERRGVTDDDLVRFKSQSESEFINSLGSIAGKVNELSSSELFAGDPNRIGKDLAAIRQVTKEDVMRVYRQYIKDRPAVILSILPKGGTVAPAAPDNFSVDSSHYTAPDYGYAGLVYHRPKDDFDRNVHPIAGPPVQVKVPEFYTAQTPNGVRIIGTETREIPAVTINLSIKGGALWASQDSMKAGLATVVAQLLGDATEQYTAEGFSDALDKLGSTIAVTAKTTSIDLGVFSLSRNLDATLELLRERLFHPKFTAEALTRVKKQLEQGFQQRKTQAAPLASAIFAQLLYQPGNVRSYALGGTEQTIARITLADVQKFYDRYFAPGLTSVQVVGDVSENEIKKKLAFLDTWPAKTLSVPPADSTGRPFDGKVLYLVDVPHAAQSELRIGYALGIDYDATGLAYRLGLANYNFGGGFNSRINLDLREAKGWTYGAFSGFSFGEYGGYWGMQAGVRAASTDSAVRESWHDLREYAQHGITADELHFMQQAIGQSDALKYETNPQKAAFLQRIQEYGLKPDYVQEQNKILKGISTEEIDALASRYLDPEQMGILVVGDKEKILPGLQTLGLTIVELDADGNRK
ncbi:MAG TPA: pitrilysin family protein [Puia sp.]|nr:pitrilysin family protein [Puia sp.]